jgi:hypothetical protein
MNIWGRKIKEERVNKGNWNKRKTERQSHTSATGAVCAVTVTANLAGTNNRAVDVLGVVVGDVTSTTTTVRNLRDGRHVFGLIIIKRGEVDPDVCFVIGGWMYSKALLECLVVGWWYDEPGGRGSNVNIGNNR